MKLIAENKAVRHEYFIEDSLETGIALDGGEVKSVKAGNVQLKDGYCQVADGSLVLKNVHIAVYDKSGAFNQKDSRRDRVLLAHKHEIIKLAQQTNEKGYALIPLKIYLEKALIKVEVGVCKGKHTYDKRETLKEKDIKRQTDREIKDYK